MTRNRKEFRYTLRDEFTLEDFSGSLNQVSPPDKVPVNDFLRFQNARVCDDAKSFERRPGTVKIAEFTERVLGVYGINETEETKLLVCLNDDIQIKIGGAWASIFSPTKEDVSPVQIAQHKGLTFIAGYEKPIMVRAGAALYPGLDAPAAAPAADAVASGSEFLIESYPETNVDNLGELRQNAARTLIAQSFKATSAKAVTKVVLKLKKVGSLGGNLWVEIHSSTAGTSGTKNTSANIVGEASDNVPGADLINTHTSIEFNFTGTKPSLEANTTYWIVLYGDYSVSASAFAVVGFGSTSPGYVNGKYYEIDGSFAWTDNNGVDLVFEVWGQVEEEGGILISYGNMDTGCYNSLRSTTGKILLSQSFKLSQTADITTIGIPLVKSLGEFGEPPVGAVWVEIHSSQAGTSATKGASANIVGQPSDEIGCEQIDSEGYAWRYFGFSGSLPSLAADTTYYLVLYGNYDVDPDKNIRWTEQGGYADGEGFLAAESMTWYPGSPDHSFKVYGYQTTITKDWKYAFTNLDVYTELREAAGATLLAQSILPYWSGSISSIKLYLAKVGSPTGNVWVEIHSAQAGTSGTKNASTAIVGEASDDIDVSTLDAFPTYSLKTFAFSGVKPPVTQGSTYYIVVYGNFAVSDVNFVRVGIDKDAPTSPGKLWELDASYAWTQKPGADAIYYVYRATVDMVGTFSYVITFLRGGNYPCESNPSPVSANVTVAAGESVALSGIPISSDPSVTARNVYRTEAGMATHKWAFQIADNLTVGGVYDNMDDAGLGDDVSYENSRPPPGTTLETWDGRLWVAGVPGYDEMVFPSGLDTPEQFDITYNVMCREREAGKVLKIMEFDNELWAFKAASVWKIARSGDSFIVDKLVEDVGLGAVGSAVRCGAGKLIFLSNHKKIEILTPTGLAVAEVPISAKVKTALAGINSTAIHKCVAGNYPGRGEYRLAVPTGKNTEPDTVIVFNYLRGTFGLDTYNHNPTSMDLTDYALGSRAFIQGASSGAVYRIDEEAVTDDGVGIAMDVQTGWFTTPTRIKIFKTYLDYILPENNTLSFRAYRDFKGTASWEKTLSGNTPTGANPSIRDTIRAKLGMALIGKAFSFRFISSDAAKLMVSRINSEIIHREKGGGVQAT